MHKRPVWRQAAITNTGPIQKIGLAVDAYLDDDMIERPDHRQVLVERLVREGRREQQWRSLYADVINATLEAARVKLGISTVNNLLTGLRMVGVLGLGAYQIATESGFSLGMLYAFVALQQMFSERSTGLIANLVQLRSMGLHQERMADIVLTSREYETGGAVSGSGLDEGPLELKDVSFQYGTFGTPVLESLSLTIAPGEFVAIIGSSGSGKSTLLKILLGLETPTSGVVLVNGLPLTGERLKAWRQHVGFVLQDDRLMSGSIAENISAFDPEPDQKRVEAAAKAAQVHADIVAMPMQYRSLIGEMGNALSGGQRQRVMLARALYRQPRILIMDEGTANLDAVSEEQIADLVASLGITRISVSHRPAMVRKADKVLVLEQGRLWPGGTGEHLM